MVDKDIIPIPYYATNEAYPYVLRPLLCAQGYELIPYVIGDAIKGVFFFLFSPVWISEHFISCDASWKKYLQAQHPQVKLITVGIQQAEHPNYIDMLRLPTDFQSFLAQAQPASAHWTPINTGGIDMQEKLQRFFEGHGTDSVDQVFSSLKMSITIIKDQIEAGEIFSRIRAEYDGYKNFIETWRILKNRFSNYYPFFKCLPFFFLLQKVHNLMSKINAFFEDESKMDVNFRELQIYEHIEEMHQILNEVKKYAG